MEGSRIIRPSRGNSWEGGKECLSRKKKISDGRRKKKQGSGKGKKADHLGENTLTRKKKKEKRPAELFDNGAGL